MAKINILPAKVYNRIAAGEVVNRPYSVVKELIENSIDAGATEIEIQIEDSGVQMIRVTDNGCGIERDDLQSAFLPHATSKIEKVEDLEGILSLGFRGEAVASIASVSVMTIKSKTEEGKCYQLTSQGGEIGNIIEVSGEKGTEVKVEKLFYNTPVRLKFLKSLRAEEADITSVISRFILSYPNISFTYYSNARRVLQSFGGGMEEAMVSVYGASVLKNCYCIRAEKHGIVLEGYIGKRDFSKPNKTYQCIFLNGRHIVNDTVSSAISNAYASYMMKRQYPFYVLNLKIAPDFVDVNVHPNKTDVRFMDNQKIYGCIYTMIAAILDGQEHGLQYIVSGADPEEFMGAPVVESAFEPAPESEQIEIRSVPDQTTIAVDETVESPFVDDQQPQREPSNISYRWRSTFMPYEPMTEPAAHFAPDSPVQEPTPIEPPKAPEGKIVSLRSTGFQSTLLDEGPRQFQEAEEIIRMTDAGLLYTGEVIDNEYGMPFYQPNQERTARMRERYKLNIPDVDVNPSVYENDFYAYQRYRRAREEAKIELALEDFRYKGRLFGTFLMFERKDEVFIIDQHAAHERLIFDDLKEMIEQRKVIRQQLLIPYEYKMNHFEAAFFRDNLEQICSIGIDVHEKEENVFCITAIPADLSTMNIASFVHEVLANVNGLRKVELTELFTDRIAMAACKAAVKGGTDLSKDEIRCLFRMLNGDMSLKCPHGRPIAIVLSKYYIEKLFKRKK